MFVLGAPFVACGAHRAAPSTATEPPAPKLDDAMEARLREPKTCEGLLDCIPGLARKSPR
jgi:hypothetical protein